MSYRARGFALCYVSGRRGTITLTTGMGMGMYPGMMGMGGMGYPYGMMASNPYMYSGMVSGVGVDDRRQPLTGSMALGIRRERRMIGGTE